MRERVCLSVFSAGEGERCRASRTDCRRFGLRGVHCVRTALPQTSTSSRTCSVRAPQHCFRPPPTVAHPPCRRTDPNHADAMRTHTGCHSRLIGRSRAVVRRAVFAIPDGRLPSASKHKS